MKWLKLCALIVLTLSAMRVVSWTLGWVLARLTNSNRPVLYVASNLAGFAAFVGLLVWNMFPGEPVDFGAVVFGLIVFACYCAIDLRWRPGLTREDPVARLRSE